MKLVPAAPSRIVLWPAAVAVAVPGFHILVRASPFGPNFLYVMLGMPGLALAWVVGAIWGTVRLVAAARAGAWRAALAHLVLPVVVLAAASQPFATMRWLNSLGDRIHFEIMRPTYLAEVEAMRDTGEPKLALFNWGGMVWASYGVVYDASDEIALPRGQQSAAWRRRADHSELACDEYGYGFEPIREHFYFAGFGC